MMSFLKNTQKQTLPWFMAILMACLFLCAVHVFCYLSAKRNINQNATQILILAKHISVQLERSLDEATLLNIHDCSEQNLIKMRKILWNKHFVNDLAIIKNNRVVCSAVWGNQFAAPQALSKIGFMDGQGYKKIANQGQYLPFHSLGNLTIKHDVLAVTAPYAFESVSGLSKRYSISLTTPDKKYVFFQLNKAIDRLWSFIPFQTVEKTICLKNSYFCVEIVDHYAGAIYRSPLILWITGWLGAGAGLLILYAMRYTLVWQNTLSNRLKRAIKNRLIYVEYQPIVEMKTQRISGVEALVRWKDKQYGQVSPELLIQLAEKANIDSEITKQVFDHALIDCRDYIKQDPHFSISINLGKSDLTTNDFIEYAQRKIEFYNIRPHQIVFEITERVNIEIKDLEYKIQQIKNIGCRVSLDDFGTGTSNLASLSGLSFDLIKIDRMFIRHFTSNQHWENILDAILSLAQENHHPIVFEGVETIEQFKYLSNKTSQGFIQGWLFYKAMGKQQLHDAILENQIKIMKLQSLAG